MLVNAAGFGKIGSSAHIAKEDAAVQLRMIDVNCRSLTRMTFLVLPSMSKGSRILNISSGASFCPQPGFTVYAATKAYVTSFSRGLYEEMKEEGIVVTAVCPGPVKTEFFDIAETTGKIPLYKRLVMANPKRVVRLAIMDAAVGKNISIYGITMKAFFLLCKILPHSLILRLMEE